MFSYKVGCILIVIYGFKFQSMLNSAEEHRSLFTEFSSRLVSLRPNVHVLYNFVKIFK